jgi:hypothetical protein
MLWRLAKLICQLGEAAADQQWQAFRTAAAGIHSHPDFGLAQ